MDAKKNIFRLLFLIMGYCLTMTSCSDDNNTDWNLAPLLTTRSVVTPDFDWEKADWMPGRFCRINQRFSLFRRESCERS